MCPLVFWPKSETVSNRSTDWSGPPYADNKSGAMLRRPTFRLPSSLILFARLVGYNSKGSRHARRRECNAYTALHYKSQPSPGFLPQRTSTSSYSLPTSHSLFNMLAKFRYVSYISPLVAVLTGMCIQCPRSLPFSRLRVTPAGS